MTEQEKMKQGYLWNDDDENIALQTRCKELVKQFNETPARAFEKREALLPALTIKKIFTLPQESNVSFSNLLF